MRQALGQDLVRRLPALPPSPAREDPYALLRSPAVNLAWLQWLRLCTAQAPDAVKGEPGDARQPAPGGEFVRYALRQLRRWRRRALRGIETFGHASDDERHRLRKRLKRMRYALEMLSPALPAQPLKTHMSALRRAESQLGEFNDLVVCLHMMEDLARRHAVPGPALDWLTTQRKAALKRCARSLRAYARADAGVLKTF
jgi:CHAD domain-containing protein